MSERSLFLLPQPKELAWGQGEFILDADTRIHLLPDATEKALASAQELQDEVRRATGLKLSILKTNNLVDHSNYILLAEDSQAAAAFLGDDGDYSCDAGDRPEAYHIGITPQSVIAGGDDILALHHAVQTLRQIARTEATRWPAVSIDDWPSFPYRGLMLDISRGKVPTLATLKELVDQLSFYKANVLQLYTEHTYKFPSHPQINTGCQGLSCQDILELDSYAQKRNVMLIPNLNSFGHQAHLLSLPRYAHLAESAVPWTLSPQEEGTYSLLSDLYDDMLPAFDSPFFNAGCDETWDLGKGKSAELADRIGVGRVYLQHLLRLYEMAKERGRTIQFWGDILLHHPELVGELPEDVILLDWHYEASDEYPSVELFGESGREFWVCPGTSSWNTLFPRIENANTNIRRLAQLGCEHGASGLLNTDWGDHGHYQPLGQCWYGYIYGAQQAWSGGTTEDERFDACFGALFFGPDGDAIVDAMRALGRLNILEGMPRRNASNSIYALLDDPLVGERLDVLPQETLEEIIQATEEAITTFRSCRQATCETLTLDEMIYSARMMNYMARKVWVGQQIVGDLKKIETDALDIRTSQDCVARAIDQLRALQQELADLTERFETLWLKRARRSKIDISLGHWQGLDERFDQAIAWLEERLGQAKQGHKPDCSLAEYRCAAQGYEILGQSFWRQMQEVIGEE